MKALISPFENNRICQIETKDFAVAEPLFWVNCSSEITTEWTYVENTFVPPVIPPIKIPTSVSMRQARLALFQDGLLNQVQSAINAMADPDKTTTQISWDYASVVNRDDDLVIQLSAQLGLTNDNLDAIFTLAATL